ncbi:MAG: hypothetical protein ACP5MV_01910 [Candidatus Parvarchaeum sp.]
MNNRKILEKLLSEVSNETNFKYNNAFSPSKYEIRELKYSDGMAEYSVKRDKVIIKKDVFRSLNKNLTINIFEPVDEQHDKEDFVTVKYTDKVDSTFIKDSIIKHEEAHRQANFLDLRYEGIIPEKDYHDELFFYILNLFNGKISDVYIKDQGSSYHVTYNLLKDGLKNGSIKLDDILFINKASNSYTENKEMIKNIEDYYINKKKELKIMQKDKSIKLISGGLIYRLEFDLNFKDNKGVIYSKIV